MLFSRSASWGAEQSLGEVNKSPAFQFYPTDWLSSQRITMMTPAQEGGYIRLLCYDWDKDGIPDDDQALSSLSRLGEGWFKGGSTIIKGCFNQHPTKPGFLTNERIQMEREKQRDWREKSVIGGKNSGKARGSVKRRVVEPKGNSPSPSPSSNTPAGAEGKAFIEGWCQNYEAVLHVKYSFDGGRDGKSVKELMGLGIPRLDLLEIAKKAWLVNPPNFETRQAQTIHGFRNYINQLQLLAKNGNTQNSRPNPRNIGVAKAGPSYGDAARRKQEQQAVAQQMGQTGNKEQPKAG